MVKIDESQESYEGELAEYMKALVDDILYNQVSDEEFANNIKTPKAAIQYGIGFEKDSILFFNELLKYMEPLHSSRTSAVMMLFVPPSFFTTKSTAFFGTMV